MRADSSTREAQVSGAERDDEVVAQRTLPIGDRPVDDGGHAGVALDPSCRRRLLRAVAGGGEADVGHEVGEHDLLHSGLAERRQDAFDVAQEDPVRPDHEDALVLQREAVGVQQVGGPVEGDHRLAGAGTALDDEDTRHGASG